MALIFKRLIVLPRIRPGCYILKNWFFGHSHWASFAECTLFLAPSISFKPSCLGCSWLCLFFPLPLLTAGAIFLLALILFLFEILFCHLLWRLPFILYLLELLQSVSWILMTQYNKPLILTILLLSTSTWSIYIDYSFLGNSRI